MYHCHIQFYLAGYESRVFEIVKEMQPLEHFTHAFLESGKPDASLVSRADVIFINLRGMDIGEALQALLSAKRKDAELILLAEKEQTPLLEERLFEIQDLWTLPMSDAEIRFRFSRWQQACKKNWDFWQTSQYLEATINNIPNLIWYKDKNGIHEKVNDSFCETVNKSKEQVEGRGHAYIWDVECDDPACIESEKEVMGKRKTCVSEEQITTGSGMRLLTTYKSPLYDCDESVMGTVGVAIDITRERAFEQEIMQKNHTLETIFTTIDCGVIRHTLDGKGVLSINRAALRMLGYESKEELVAEGFDWIAKSVVEEDRPKILECLKELKREGDIVSTEYRVRHKNGEMRYIMGNAKLLRENGELVYQRFLLDCTAQKIQEKENEQHQMELIQALSIEYNYVCFIDLDTGTGIQLRNEEIDRRILDVVFGENTSLIESLELYIQNFVYEEDKEMLRRAFSLNSLKKALAEKKLYSVNHRIFMDGEIKYYQMKAVRAGEWGVSHGIVLGFRSVDEEIRSEMEQRNLLEDALSQANKASRAKSMFLSNMSHDIRTPMNAIVGFTNLAMKNLDCTEMVEEYLKKIMTSGKHLLSLINDVLDMSRIESGKVRLEEKPCNLPDILHNLHSILQSDIQAKQLTFSLDIVDVLDEEIYCDMLRLNQVLLNLLGNSVKYTQEGGAVCMLVTEKASAPEGYANYEFHIKDNGIGMSEEFLAHIFEPFEREKTTTYSKVTGTGLGMAITKNIIDMMNGSIEVKSKKGEGTEFTVSLTFHLNAQRKAGKEEIEKTDALCLNEDADAVKEEPVKQEPVKEASEKPHAGRILLAEDNELNQEIAVAILEGGGFSAEVADNGQIALNMLKKSEPGYYQMVLMDVQMPVMNGYEATKEIRKLENKELASIPILAMTANAFEEDRQEALASGMNAHVTKPIDVEKLFETMEEVLNAHT